MAGAMRKMAVYLGLVEDEETDDYEGDGYDDAAVPAVRRAETPALRVTRPDERGAFPPPRRAEQVDAYRITTVHPRTYNEARTIGEHFREGVPVIMNLTEMDDADAKRLVDFSAGLIFGLRGQIERVTQKVFLLTPANVEITAEDKSMIAEGGFFNQS
jgi:cell division inhibitor SepF